MFEGQLAWILNKVLGDYVENLDKNQLNLGIWGGDVVLTNLTFKRSALAGLGLPVQCVAGSLGKLKLKIPWKDLYNSSIEATVEDLYLLVQPNLEVVYDEEQEQKAKEEAKQKEIQRYEFAKKLAEESSKTDPGFLEKLLTRIVKNVQVKISKIHIRYEDKVSSPGRPFAMGITLCNFLLQSTDENWVACITNDNDASPKIYKIGDIEALAIYWNSGSAMYSNLPVDILNKHFSDEIATKSYLPKNYHYIVGPINLSSHLKINCKPELEEPPFNSPFLDINFQMEKLAIGVRKTQYFDLIALHTTIDLMLKGIPFRKYRPAVHKYQGHYKAWWHFAYKCVLESEVRRRRKNWDWNCIMEHRNKVRKYAEVYQSKLLSKKPVKEIEDECLQLENQLDVMNIVIIRQRAELEVEKIVKKEESNKKGWFSGWWSSSKIDSKEDVTTTADILRQMESVMTPEEKAKLYRAIDYHENAPPAKCPPFYVRETCSFTLGKLEVTLFDDVHLNVCVMNSILSGVKCEALRRPAENALRVAMGIDHLEIEGLKQREFMPKLVTTDQSDTSNLLNIVFETNPIGKNCGQFINLRAKPLKIAYDAATINQVVDMFKLPNTSQLEAQLQLAAGQGLNNLKEMSALGMQYAISQHARLSLQIELHAPVVIIPYNGKYTGDENVLVANLGTFKINTVDKVEGSSDVRQLHQKGISEDQVLAKLVEDSYDEFKITFTGLQVVLAQTGEDWNKAITECKPSSMHVLNPLNLGIDIFKCLITDDPRLPQIKIKGKLPTLSLSVSDKQIIQAMSLVQSIPMPIKEPEPLDFKLATKSTSSISLTKFFENVEKRTMDTKRKEKDVIQFTNVDLQFVIEDVHLTFSKFDYNINKPVDCSMIEANSLSLSFIQQTFNMNVAVSLQSLGVKYFREESGEVINMVSTPMSNVKSLFTIMFIMVDKSSPEFHAKYHSCESLLNLDFSKLDLLLHLEALQEVLQTVNTFQSQIEEVQFAPPPRRSTLASVTIKRTISSISDTINTKRHQKSKRKKATVVESIIFKLAASLHEISVKMTTDVGDVAHLDIIGLNTELIVKKPYTQVSVHLDKINVLDCNKATKHPKIISVVGNEAIHVQVVMFNLDKDVDINKIDMKIFAKLGKIRIVFVNWFIMNVLDFLNQFQAAQKAIIEASQQAAANAKMNMKQVYEKATRIALDIDLKAPDIVVPENTQSYNGLLLSMGNLRLSNKFKDLLEIKNENGHNVVLDEMVMALTDFQLVRASFGQNYEIKQKTNILQPMNIIFNVIRNLSCSWYKPLPDVDISGHSTVINVTMSQMDYKIVMNILSGNLTEGQNDPKHKGREELAKISSTSVDESTYTVTVDLPEQRKMVEERVTTTLKFTFTMDSFIVNLYMCDEINSFDLEKCNGLARFSLEGLSVKGTIFSDGTISTSLLLVNCLLDDMRKGRAGKLNRLMERKQDANEDVNKENPVHKSMVDMTVQIKQNDTFVDLRVYSFMIILSVDYMKTIADFFVTQQQASLGEAIKEVKVTSSKSSHYFANAEVNTPTPPVEKSKSIFTVNIKLEKPDIILVEHMDNMDTNALILNSEVVMKLRMSGDHQVLSGTIKDIQMYTCAYDPAKRAETRGTVLEPVSISIAGSTPENKGLHLEVHVTDVKISISPATLELLNRVHVTAMGGTERLSEIKSQTEDDYSDIWKIKQFEDSDYWFLRTEVGEDALSLPEHSLTEVNDSSVLKEICLISMPVFIITVEAGIGNKTLPMLTLSSGFQGNVKNWSTAMSLETSLSLQMGYYNSYLAMWEPLIEPVAVINNNVTTYVPWEIKFEMSMMEQGSEISMQSPSEESTETRVRGPNVIIDISSKSSLELTVTKTCLEVLTNLGNAFANAMTTQEIKATVVSAPYIVKNNCGTRVTLLLQYTCFKVYNQSEELREIVLEDGAEAQLEVKANALTKAITKDIFHKEKNEEILLRVRVNEMECDLDIPVVRANVRYFPLNYRQDNSDTWGLISAIKVDDGVKVITLRSILQVHNNFSIPIDVYYMTEKGNELQCIATIAPSSTFNVPFKAVYSRTNELFFSVNGYSVTTTPFIWKNLQQNIAVNEILQCASKNANESKEPFILKAVGEMQQVFLENTNKRTMVSTSYHLYLRPAINLQNCLPVNVISCIYDVSKEEILEPGDIIPLPNVEPGSCKLVLRLSDYLEKEWSCHFDVPENQQEFTVCQFNSHDGSSKTTLELGLHVYELKGTITMSLYCPFWMINKTGLMLSYRNTDENANVLHHPPSYNGPILFSFNAKNFFGKKKASIRIGQGEWSDKFSLDVAGSSGVVVCKSNNMIYQVGVQNQLTYNGLTKQITFTPYYVVINNSPFDIECQEMERPADPWLHIEPQSCSAIWPKSEQEDKLLRVRIKDTEDISAPFLFTESHTTLLKLKNKYGGVNVDIQMTEGAVYINFAEYMPGLAPALLINHTRDTLRLWEKDNVQVRKLEPHHSTYYTWENPSGSRILCWDIGNNKEMEDDLRRDDIREFCPRENDQKVYWVSFLDGMQRVLLFTEDETVADEVQSAKQFEEQQQEINVSIHGLGLSLVNNETRQEIMYIGIASSGIIWQQSKSPTKRYKPMNAKDNYNMEVAYQQYLERAYIATEDFGRAIVDSKTEVDFIENVMLKPHKRYIKRTFQTGLWMQMKSSLHQMQLHAKINRLQIDNQMFDCIFPVVLAPVPPPKSVALDNYAKPFAELSIVQRLIKHSQIKQYKYFKVLIQEFHIKVDLGFVNAVLEMLNPTKPDDNKAEKDLFLSDLKMVKEPLYALVSSQSLEEQKNFYDLLHFSPLKIHVSFSMASGGSNPMLVTPNFISVLLQGLGVTLTDLQDVVFKLAFFERNYTFLTKKQLISEASGHYIGQSVKQLYVLVLGLDVLGNPYGLVIGITKGVGDLFYEPFQGAIQGPGEFAEGLVLGVRSLFGHTVGGAAGAVSRITGAMGKGIAALTFDKDYQRKRRDQLNKKPATVQEGFARGGKGLVMGVVDGLTGVFTKPISGAKEQGVEGFFKGLGKGAVGLVTRPTAGVIDFASGSLDAVKRCTEVGNEEIVRLRPPRFLTSDKFVCPYNPTDAFGNRLLNELEKGKYANTDVYAYHLIVIEKKEILILTDKRVAYITHNDIFGSWQIDWAYTWSEIKQPATVSPKGVSISISEQKRKKLGLFGSSDLGKTILIADPQLRNDLCTKIEELRRNA